MKPPRQHGPGDAKPEPNKEAPEFSRGEEYKILREEVMLHMQGFPRTQTWGTVACAIVYTWLLTNRRLLLGPSNYAWFIPPLIMLACAAVNVELTLRIRNLGKYLYQIEEVVFPKDSKATGWEHFKRKLGGTDYFANFLGVALWLAGIAVASFASWHFFRFQPLTITGTFSQGPGLQLQFTAMPNRLYVLLTTTNPASPAAWTPILTNSPDADGNWTFVDTNAATVPPRFYRLSIPAQ